MVLVHKEAREKKHRGEERGSEKQGRWGTGGEQERKERARPSSTQPSTRRRPPSAPPRPATRRPFPRRRRGAPCARLAACVRVPRRYRRACVAGPGRGESPPPVAGDRGGGGGGGARGGCSRLRSAYCLGGVAAAVARRRSRPSRAGVCPSPAGAATSAAAAVRCPSRCGRRHAGGRCGTAPTARHAAAPPPGNKFQLRFQSKSLTAVQKTQQQSCF